MIEWSNISERISYYTYEMKEFIPESSGFYAWYFPLWIYDADLVEYIKLVTEVFAHEETADPSDGYVHMKKDLNWAHLKLKIKRERHQIKPCEDSLVEEWKEAMKSDEAKKVLEETMMTASIIMPPLYVGKADNLNTRYEQHTANSLFKERFEKRMKELELNIGVSQLIFCAVEIDPKTNVKLKNKRVNELVEKVVMRMAGPPFSKV